MAVTADLVQCFCFIRNIGYGNPNIIYFYYLKKCFKGQSIHKTLHFTLKTEALILWRVNFAEHVQRFGFGRFIG